jgi:serine/threonine protein kinase
MADHPQAIGKYRITRPLGKGAMGMVYEGFDPIIERKVAIKTILAEYLDAAEMEEAVARFRREAQAGGRLQHPGIVGVYEYGHEGEMAFIVMEYVEGQELKRMLSGGKRLDLIDVFEIMKQLLAALDYSHKQGVVHRDIKPANLMIQPGPKVKVMDFGIARLESSSLTQVGTVVGTPTHMSPEQLMGLPADGRADLWSAGVILYELLTGTSPFIADSPMIVMNKVLQAEVEKPTALNPSLPPGFDNIVARALAKKPEERFQTAREFAATLVQALQGKPVSATSTARPSSAQGAAPGADSRARDRGEGRERAPRVALAPETLADIERSLSRHVGPLGKLLVKRGQAQATSLEDFFRILAENIPSGDEQAAFLGKMKSVKPMSAEAPRVDATLVTGVSPAVRAPAFAPEVLANAEKALASYVGPLARVFIKDAAGKSGNLKELYAQLAAHIDSEDERRAFLATLGR